MLCPHERKIAVAFERDTGADTGGEDHAISAASAVPVARQLLHGAGVLPERHAGPFLQAPSEHTLRKERPPAWSAPSIPARTPGAANENPQARRHITHNYSPQSPWPDDAGTRREKVLRPATAGQKHESQAWYLFRLPACLHILTHQRTHAPTTVHSHRSLAARRFTQALARDRWVSDAHAATRWSSVAAGSREAERLRWDNNAHNLTDGYALRAERKRSKQLAVIHMPEFLKVRAPPPGERAEWLPPQRPPAVANPVHGRSFGQVVKLTNVKGKRWIAGGYYNRNYHGKGVYIARLQQDRQGNPVEWM